MSEVALNHANYEVDRPAPNETGPRSVVSAEVLKQRPLRLPDHAAENRALIGLAQSMATAPEDILQSDRRARIVTRELSDGLN